MNTVFRNGDEVSRALAAGTPVVALETTVVTHGLPHPEGVKTAHALEDVIRRAGATPATIGILRGAIRVGLTHAELEQLATTPNVAKVNLSNLAATLSAGCPGSTTVAATMFAAHASVFSTGGIGGVHRDVEESGDVSADLSALARIPIAVVSAGAKAMLDLVANPIPAADEMPSELYERAIQTALADADTRGVRGRALTPFLLERMRMLTGGESIRANQALLRHNAKAAADLAIALAEFTATG